MPEIRCADEEGTLKTSCTEAIAREAEIKAEMGDNR